jgi:hypothetical protein
MSDKRGSTAENAWLLVGAGSVVAGVAWMYPPAGLIVGGLVVVTLTVMNYVGRP